MLIDSPMIPCKHCAVAFAPRKATSVLKLSYCSFTCESNGIGFSIDAFIKNPLTKKVVEQIDAS